MTITSLQTPQVGTKLDLKKVQSAALGTYSIDAIQYMTIDDLHKLQQALMLGDNWGCLVIPKQWMPSGSSQSDRSRTTNLRKSLMNGGCLQINLDAGVLSLMRFSLLMWLSPSSGGRGMKILKPSSWHTNMSYITRLVAYALGKPGGSLENPLASITRADLEGMKLTFYVKQRMISELARIRTYAERGLWSDAPTLGKVKIDGQEPSRREDAEDPPEELKSKPYQPLPDEFVAQAGWRFSWISANLGPNLLQLVSRIKEVIKELPVQGTVFGPKYIRKLRTRRVGEFLATFKWMAQDGRLFNELPFDLKVRGLGSAKCFAKGEQRKKGVKLTKKGPKEFMTWPPTQWSHVLSLLQLLQIANLFIFFLSVGSRVSEAMSLKPNCLVLAANGITLADGLTYKLSGNMFEGEARNWALPEVAVGALKMQQELVVLLADMGGLIHDLKPTSADDIESLWFQMMTFGAPLEGTENQIMKNMVEALQLTGMLQGNNISTHRFRKTIARLIALALVGAPKILMDLFGHKTIEMTLHYILGDPMIRAEMDEVAKAQTIMFVEGAIKDIDNCGGKAAKRLIPIVQAERIRHGKEWGAQNIRELAEILTLDGRQTQVVRDNVLCMKTALQVGPCARGRTDLPNPNPDPNQGTPIKGRAGLPNPAQCTPMCDHRLELAAAKQDADGALAASVRGYEADKADDNPIMMEFWSGQVMAALPRFDEVRDKWIKHPAVQEIIKNTRAAQVT